MWIYTTLLLRFIPYKPIPLLQTPLYADIGGQQNRTKSPHKSVLCTTLGPMFVFFNHSQSFKFRCGCGMWVQSVMPKATTHTGSCITALQHHRETQCLCMRGYIFLSYGQFYGVIPLNKEKYLYFSSRMK